MNFSTPAIIKDSVNLFSGMSALKEIFSQSFPNFIRLVLIHLSIQKQFL